MSAMTSRFPFCESVSLSRRDEHCYTMPPQQESRCWILALVVGLIAVTGLTGATLWFALRANDDVNPSQQVGEHDWGSTQEQALVEEVVSTSTAGEYRERQDALPEHQQPEVVEHLEDVLVKTEQREDLPASVGDTNVNRSSEEDPNVSLQHQDQQKNEPVYAQPLESIFGVRDEEETFVHPVERKQLNKMDKVTVDNGEGVLVQPEHVAGQDGESAFVHPEDESKQKKMDSVIAQKGESVLMPYSEGPVVRDGVHAFVLPEEIHKLKKADAVIVKMTDNGYVHPEHLGAAPLPIIGDRNNVFVHPEDQNKLKRMDLEMLSKGQSMFMHTEYPSILQKKEPGFKSTFLPPEDRVHEHRNQLEKLESEDEHFFSQYFEYPHDRDHHGLLQDGKLPWETEHEDYLYKGPEQYDGEEPEYSENPIANFLQQKLQDLYNWISSDEDLIQADSGTGRELLEVVQALNRSLAEGNSSLLLDKLKQIYQSRNGTPNIVQSNSLVSFGLLAFDLLLLRNVQQIAWQEDDVTARKMMQDPDVLALSALFMPPEEVRQLQDPEARQKDVEKEDKGILYDIMEFINGSLRAVLNLGRAYRDGINVLDCVWTLYCRNLDKSAGLRGPYGFLARINSVGLRLAMGDFPVENTLELLVGETSRDTAHMDCDKLFPRCKTQEAAEVVLRSTLG